MAPINVNVSNGLKIFKSIDLDESEEQVKGAEGQVFFIYASNTNAAARWLKLYNATAANVTVGTTVPAKFLIQACPYRSGSLVALRRSERPVKKVLLVRFRATASEILLAASSVSKTSLNSA